MSDCSAIPIDKQPSLRKSDKKFDGNSDLLQRQACSPTFGAQHRHYIHAGIMVSIDTAISNARRFGKQDPAAGSRLFR